MIPRTHMKVRSPFFVIGTVGMLVTATLHMLMAMVLVGPAVHPVFLGTYPVFLVFLALGTARMRRVEVPVRYRKR